MKDKTEFEKFFLDVYGMTPEFAVQEGYHNILDGAREAWKYQQRTIARQRHTIIILNLCCALLSLALLIMVVRYG